MRRRGRVRFFVVRASTRVLTFLAIVSCFASRATAEPTADDELVFSVGAFGLKHYGGDPKDAQMALGAEVRSGWELGWIKPFVGLLGTSDGCVLGYGGLLLDIPLVAGARFTPSAALAGFGGGGGPIDLGSPVEFRSSVELSYPVPGSSRVGVLFFHVSNAGLSERNPGAESLAVAFSTGFD